MSVSSIEFNGFSVWWDPTQPERFRMAIADPTLVDENGEKPGLQVVFSANPKSADYNPASFNRFARRFRQQLGQGPADAPIHSRRLTARTQVIATLNGSLPTAAPTAPTAPPVQDPTQFGWATCPRCFSIVVQMDGHDEVCGKG